MIFVILFFAFIFLLFKFGHKSFFFNLTNVDNDETEEYNMPWFMPYTNTNAAYVFVQLGVKLLTVDREDSALKRDFIHRYVRKTFQLSSIDFREHYITSLRYQHSSTDLAKYFKSKLKTKEKLLSVVRFLCGLAYADGIIMSSERKYIDDFCLQLGLTLEDVSVVVNIYFAKQQEQNEQEKAKSKRSSYSGQSTSSRISLQKRYSVILDIPENSDAKKIKSAYRKLAKKWHPDLMYNHSEAEQKYALEKFREIQEAYDYLNQN